MGKYKFNYWKSSRADIGRETHVVCRALDTGMNRRFHDAQEKSSASACVQRSNKFRDNQTFLLCTVSYVRTNCASLELLISRVCPLKNLKESRHKKL